MGRPGCGRKDGKDGIPVLGPDETNCFNHERLAIRITVNMAQFYYPLALIPNRLKLQVHSSQQLPTYYRETGYRISAEYPVFLLSFVAIPVCRYPIGTATAVGCLPWSIRIDRLKVKRHQQPMPKSEDPSRQRMQEKQTQRNNCAKFIPRRGPSSAPTPPLAFSPTSIPGYLSFHLFNPFTRYSGDNRPLRTSFLLFRRFRKLSRHTFSPVTMRPIMVASLGGASTPFLAARELTNYTAFKFRRSRRTGIK